MYKLKPGDKVAVIAPCGQINTPKSVKFGLDYLRSLGLDPVLGKNLLETYRYMAGTEQQRAADLNTAFADPTIKAIFCARAAAGGSRILPYINYELVSNNPKPLIGFCDNAAIQLALWQKSKLISYNGMVLNYDFSNPKLDSLIKDNLEKLL